MTKQKINEKGYFIGVTKKNQKVYLQKPSWDCDWYWGFGYIEYYNNIGRPSWQQFTHWDIEFKKGVQDIQEQFKTLTLSENNLYKLEDYMLSYYTLRETADLFTRGNSHQTTTDLDLKNQEWADKINKEILPKIFEEIDKLFRQ